MNCTVIPNTIEWFEGELFDVETGSEVHPSEMNGCNCDMDYLCHYPPCREAQAATQASYAWMANAPRISRDEWNDVYSDNMGKRDSYDRLAAI